MTISSIIDITDDTGHCPEPRWLAVSEAVHRQLRPDLPRDYVATMRRIFAQGGRMSVAVRGDAVVGVAVHRIHENTAFGLQMYVDDLVTDEAQRSTGVGRALFAHLQAIAGRAGCRRLTLDSNTSRSDAHRFYHREGMTIIAFHFAKPVAPQAAAGPA